MQDIRFAAVSMNGPLGQTELVIEEIGGWCRKAADEGAEFVFFPELVVHGRSTGRLIELAAKYKLVLSVGLSEKESDIVYNTQVLIGPDGYIGKQRKIHLSRDEVLYYKGGRDIPVFDIGKCNLGTVI